MYVGRHDQNKYLGQRGLPVFLSVKEICDEYETFLLLLYRLKYIEHTFIESKQKIESINSVLTYKGGKE